MKRKIIAILTVLALALTLAACGGGGEETTMTGMVVSLEGTVVSLADMGDMNFEEGEMPEGMENFNPGDFTLPEGETFPAGGEGMTPPEGMENFNPGDFTLPEGETFPAGGEGMTPPEGMENFNPGDFSFPEGEMPEDMTMPADGEWSGGMPGFGGFSGDMETTEVDIANAHISVEIDGGKASGTLEDVAPGAFVTITLNAKGEATYVLVSEGVSFGGRGGER